jgi:hypothetical protein
MKNLLALFIVIATAASAQESPAPPRPVPAPASISTAPVDSLNEHLQPFKSYLNRTWKGTFIGESGQPPMYDIARWERILNGQAIRMMHSVNKGIYGGETILFWDKSKKSLVYYYFTTAGFFTQGTMSVAEGKWVAHEYVANNANGITEVRSTSEFRADGSMFTVAEFLQNGSWVPGHSIEYVEEPGAEMIFR